MVNRLEIVRRFVEEERQARPELVGVLLTGSVARGEDSEFSDCDLTFLVDESSAPTEFGSSAEWREGVYLDVFGAPQQEYNDVERVLASAFSATHMNDALILYDPSGVFTRVQQDVRAVYMQPVHVRTRLVFWLEFLQGELGKAPAALAAGDPIALCCALAWIPFGIGSLWLLRAGITPSSTRMMIQLGGVDGDLKARLLDFLGASGLDAAAVKALVPLSQAAVELDEVQQGLTAYMVQKGAWMTQHGFHKEALFPLWHPIRFVADNCVASPALIAQVGPLVEAWLAAVGWTGNERAKMELAQELLAEAEAMVGTV